MSNPSAMPKWIEVTPDYRCNNRCLGCFAVQDDGPSMTTREALGELARGRQQGITSLWIGGGEPTLRRDLFTMAKAARHLGYERVRIQTNGMLLSYPDFVAKAADAGITEVSFSIKGATAEMHDALARTPGCYALMLKGMRNARERGLTLEGDILVYRDNTSAIPEMVRFYFDEGLVRFSLWLLSAADSEDPEVTAAVPKIADVVPFITKAMDLGLSPRPDFITSLHTPPCTVPASHHACLFFAPDLGLLVTNPGGYRFPLEDSPMEGGTFFEGCGVCRKRARCGGARADYVKLYGPSEFVPVD